MDVITACTMDCPDACSLVATVHGGQTIKLRGNPEHPFTAGFTCRKIKKHLKRLQSPERILYPMLRKGRRWERVSWTTALDLCVEKITPLRKNPAAIAHVHASGAKGITKEAVSLFFDSLGASRTRGSLCDAAGIMAYHYDFGSRRNHHTDDLFNAHRMINWGKDLWRSSIHLAAIVQKARKKGASVLLISPCPEGNQTFRDHHILIRPGTDRFLAAAVARRLVIEGNESSKAVENARHWHQFKQLLIGQEEKALRLACGVSQKDVDLLYDYYMADGPAATLIGAGLQRYAQGGENVRFINALALLSGHIGQKGGGSYFHLHSTGLFNMNWARAPHRPKRRSLQIATIGRDLIHAKAPKIKMLWINGVNIVNQGSHSHRIVEAFKKIPFKVVVDAFFNDTALRADLVLPSALMLEQEDLIGSYLHNHIQHVPQVVHPPGEAQTDLWIVSEIGRRLTPAIHLPNADTCMQAALDTPDIAIDLATIKTIGSFEVPIPKVAYHGMQFDHPGGKSRLPMQLHSEAPAPENFPLRLLSLIRREAVHSQIPPEDQTGLPSLWIASDSSALTRLDLNRPVYIVSPLGRIQVHVNQMVALHPDAVVYRRGDWMALGGGVNRIIADQATDIGNGVAYYHQYVRLENG